MGSSFSTFSFTTLNFSEKNCIGGLVLVENYGIAGTGTSSASNSTIQTQATNDRSLPLSSSVIYASHQGQDAVHLPKEHMPE